MCENKFFESRTKVVLLQFGIYEKKQNGKKILNKINENY